MKKVFWWSLVLSLLAVVFWFGSAKLYEWDRADEDAYQKEVENWKKQSESMGLVPGSVREVDVLISQRRLADAEKALKDLEKSSPSNLRSLLADRQGTIQYQRCEEYLERFAFFAENDKAELAAEERDRADAECRNAEQSFNRVLTENGNQTKFFGYYALGNTYVRQAMLAASLEAQGEALLQAIGNYREALKIRDDYETKVNLELLLKQKSALDAAAKQGSKKPLSPKDFDIKLKDKGPGAGAGATPKSRL